MVKIPQTAELKVFLDELFEQLDYLDDAIINLEKNPTDKETLEEVFRVAHTIKGSAGFLDLKNLVSLGHAMENVFTEFYNDNVAISSEAIDALLESKDAISAIGNSLAAGEDTQKINVDDLVIRINSFISEKTALNDAKDTKGVSSLGIGVTEAIAGTKLVRIWISPEEVVPSIRAFLVKKKLSDIAQVIKMQPEEVFLETDEFSNQKERIVNFYAQTNLSKDEVHQLINVDLIDRIEILDEAEQRKAVATGEKKENTQKVQQTQEATNTVRIPVTRLDILLNLIGEMVIANSGFIPIQDELKKNSDLDHIYRNVRDRTRDLYRISSDIQELVMISRLVPIGQVFTRFKRFVRDYSRRTGKKIQLQIEGESTEIDKKIIDEVSKPLTHLVRNSLDHGIEEPEERAAMGKTETATLLLKAFQEGNYINIVVEDDGRGLNYQQILEKAVQRGLVADDEAAFISEAEIKNFIFKSGFSTKSEADELSGRGIGMDVVKRSVEMLNGTLDIDSFVDSGTKITLKLPLTLAILNALMVKVGDETMAIPMSSIIETQKVTGDQLITIEGNLMVKLRDSIISLINLGDIFNIENKGASIGSRREHSIIVVEHADSQMGILVDDFINRQEVVIKSLTEHYRHIDGISGASILGDGSIILIIDIHGTIQLFKDQNFESGQADLLLTSGGDFHTFEAGGESIKLYTQPPEEELNQMQGDEHIPGAETMKVGEVEIDSRESGGIALINQEYTSADLQRLKQTVETDNSLLKQWIKLGNDKVIEGMQSLTNSADIRMGKCKVKRVSFEKLQKFVNKLEQSEKKIVDFALPIIPFNGRMHFVLTHSNAIRIVKMMWQAASLPPMAEEEYTYEPLYEVTNILGSAYTNSLTEVADVAVEPGLPSLIEGIGKFKEELEDLEKEGETRIIYIENLIYWGKKDLLAELLIMLPSIKVDT